MKELLDCQWLNTRLHPCCMDWCREDIGIDKNGLPPSDHAPGCENRVLVPFAILQVFDDGDNMGKVFMSPLEAQDAIEDEASSADYFWIDTIMATEDQIGKLPEFEG